MNPLMIETIAAAAASNLGFAARAVRWRGFPRFAGTGVALVALGLLVPAVLHIIDVDQHTPHDITEFLNSNHPLPPPHPFLDLFTLPLQAGIVATTGLLELLLALAWRRQSRQADKPAVTFAGINLAVGCVFLLFALLITTMRT